MRRYELTLTNPSGQIVALSASGFSPSTSGLATFSSRIPNPNGAGTINNGSALNVEFDIPVAPYATPQGLASIRVWGIGLAQIAQSTNLSGYSLSLLAGMAPGLPLATAAAPQAGIVVQGAVYQSFGNWQGTAQSLDLVVQPGAISTPAGGIPFTWSPGQPLKAALTAALGAAFPTYVIDVQISSTLVQSSSKSPVPAHYDSLSDFADMILQQSQALGTAAGNQFYPGVQINVRGNSILAYDGTVAATPTQLAFADLIGQPTWLSASQVSFKTVMRADIQLGDYVQFPKGITSPYVLTTAAAAVPGAASRSSSAFQGSFLIQEVHHFGSFRQSDADSWATAFVGVSTATPS